MHPVNDSAGAIYVRGRPKYSSFFGIRDLTRLKAGVRNLWKNWERYLDGLQPYSQDLSLGFCSVAKGEVLGTRLMETGPIDGLREIFLFSVSVRYRGQGLKELETIGNSRYSRYDLIQKLRSSYRIIFLISMTFQDTIKFF